MQKVATTANDAFGTETDNAVEATVATQTQALGICEGTYAEEDVPTASVSDIGDTFPFVIKPMICLNRANNNYFLPKCLIRIRLATNAHFLMGDQFDINNSSFQISDLSIRYRRIVDDGKRGPVTFQVVHTYEDILNSNYHTSSTFVPNAPCDAVYISFISTSLENQANGRSNYLQLQPPPGIAPYPANSAAATSDTGHYGIERLIYGVNDTETAVLGYTIVSREEVLMNALRAYGVPPAKYATLIRNFQDPIMPNYYIAGIGFGGLIDFTTNKFSVEFQTQVTSATTYAVYFYFRTYLSIQA